MASLLVNLLTVLALAGDGSSGIKGNAYVDVTISLTDSTIRQGSSGAVQVLLTPAEGIHINADPPVSITLRGLLGAKNSGVTTFSINKENGFLLPGDPVEQQFTIPGNAAAGTDTLSGSVVYYFCSDTEGWCRKFTQPFAIPIHILAK